MNKELQSLLTDLEKFIYQIEKDKFILDVHQVHLILDHIANRGVEIERLNNIIDELEKYINKRIDYETTPIEAETYYLDVLNKLKELRNKNAK